MIIKTTNGKEIDTNSLPDMDAMVLEKMEDFVKFCDEHDIQFITSYLFNNKIGGAQHFNSKSDDPKLTGQKVLSIYENLFQVFEKLYPGFKVIIVPNTSFEKIKGENL